MPKFDCYTDVMRRKLLTQDIAPRRVETILAEWNFEYPRAFYREIRCEAIARSTGRPCRAMALRNGRCRNHGGCSTGPRTEEGRRRISEAQKARHARRRAEKLISFSG